MWVDGVTPAGLTLRLTDAELSSWRFVDLSEVAPFAARHRARRP
jgi:hypothetical protein